MRFAAPLIDKRGRCLLRRVGATTPKQEATAPTNWEGVTIQAMRRALRIRGVSEVNRLTKEDCIRLLNERAGLEEQGGIPDESEKDI